MTVEDLALLICTSLERSPAVEIDGLGVFARGADGLICFSSDSKPRVFIAYAAEDAAAAERIYSILECRGYSPWMDRKKLLPGQNWPRRLQDAIESADFFVACFSAYSVNKRGAFQAEIRYALDCARRVPLDDVFLIPVRLDDCRMPHRIQRETQYVDLFPDWQAGIERVVQIMRQQSGHRAYARSDPRKRQLPDCA